MNVNISVKVFRDQQPWRPVWCMRLRTIWNQLPCRSALNILILLNVGGAKSFISGCWIACWQTLLRTGCRPKPRKHNAPPAKIKVEAPNCRAALKHFLSLHQTLLLSAHCFSFLPTNCRYNLCFYQQHTHTERTRGRGKKRDYMQTTLG